MGEPLKTLRQISRCDVLRRIEGKSAGSGMVDLPWVMFVAAI
jgi:hypothetical protein